MGAATLQGGTHGWDMTAPNSNWIANHIAGTVDDTRRGT